VSATAAHIPVLLDEVVEALRPRDGARILDGTFGAGGYAGAILNAALDVRVIGIDRDPSAIADGAPLVKSSRGRLTLVQGRFGDLDFIARRQDALPLDGIVLDVGVSSMQIDQAQRGFSFRQDGPLDMRMEAAGPSAANLVNGESEARLADIFYYYGEERRARPIARAIVAERKLAPIETTAKLASVIATVVWPRPGQIDPATRSFQGLRIAVNDELGELVRALHAAERALTPGGRLAIVTFHSLEDRIVKQFLGLRSGRGMAASRPLPGEVPPEPPTFDLVSRGAIKPGEAEVARNPRSRSANLRVAERTAAPARGADARVTKLAELPDPGRTRR